MIIGGIGGNRGANAGAGAVHMGTGGTDAYSKSLQKQIMEAQKQLQELSGNESMTSEMKRKKRQELQKQISDLNMQLRQHQMEERRKAQEEKQESQAKSQPKKEEQAGGLSNGSMQAMISAEGSIKLAKQQGGTAKKMQNGANIKRIEIKLDGGGSERRADDSAAISSKWDDVEGMEQKAKDATASQMSLLAKAQEEASKAGEESSTGTKTDKVDEKGNTKTQKQDSVSNEEEQNGGITMDKSKQPAAIGSNVDVRI